MMKWPVKDPNDKADYSLDWRARLVDGDLIASSVFEVETGAVVLTDAAVLEGQWTRIWIEGGQEGETARIRNRVITTGGRQWDMTVELPVRTL